MRLLPLVVSKQANGCVCRQRKIFFSVSWSTYYLVVACTIYNLLCAGSKYNKSQHRIKKYDNNKQNAQRELERASERASERKEVEKIPIEWHYPCFCKHHHYSHCLNTYELYILLLLLLLLLSLSIVILLWNIRMVYCTCACISLCTNLLWRRIIADSNVFVTVLMHALLSLSPFLARSKFEIISSSPPFSPRRS